MQQTHSLPGKLLHRAQQRGLGIQCFSVVRAEGSWDKEGAVPNKRRRGRVPGGVAARFKGCPQAAGGEGGGIRLALNQRFAGKLHRNLPLSTVGGQKGIVLSGSKVVHRLEPVRIVGRTLF